MWTAQDWTYEILRRYRNAARATAEAQEFDRQASVVVDRMKAEDAATIADLFADVGLDFDGLDVDTDTGVAR